METRSNHVVSRQGDQVDPQYASAFVYGSEPAGVVLMA
jgi:hypothetical protein